MDDVLPAQELQLAILKVAGQFDRLVAYCNPFFRSVFVVDRFRVIGRSKGVDKRARIAEAPRYRH